MHQFFSKPTTNFHAQQVEVEEFFEAIYFMKMVVDFTALALFWHPIMGFIPCFSHLVIS